MAPAVIRKVYPDSTAHQMGIVAGDTITSVNSKSPRDVIDYRFEVSADFVTLLVSHADGTSTLFEIEKEYDDTLGIEFCDDVFDSVMVCKNNCLFCFVHNLPQGLRSSLYIRDDDYRLSFLHGNFITLTNVSETDIARIEEQALSPLYVSVHATEPHTRAALMRNPAAAQIMEVMTRLASHGIRFHCQIVVCAGLNDGETLDRTLSDLASLRPAVLSVGVVPVGLTRFYRSEAIRRLNDCEATNLLIQLDAWCRKNRGEQWLFAADELFIQARRRIPPVSYYADFPQLENGIGLVRLFLERAHAVTQPPDRIETPKKVTLVTAPLFYPYLRDFASRYDKVLGLDVEVLRVKNHFFGEMVTVTGLLTATDIYKALAESSAHQIIVPDCCQKEGFFLDGLNVVELQSKIRGSVCIVASDPVSLNERILDT